jgi:hypothetical protein
MRRLITKNGRQVYTWDVNEKSDEELAAQTVAQTVVDAVTDVVKDVVDIAQVAVPMSTVDVVPIDIAKTFTNEVSGGTRFDISIPGTGVIPLVQEVSVDNG